MHLTFRLNYLLIDGWFKNIKIVGFKGFSVGQARYNKGHKNHHDSKKIWKKLRSLGTHFSGLNCPCDLTAGELNFSRVSYDSQSLLLCRYSENLWTLKDHFPRILFSSSMMKKPLILSMKKLVDKFQMWYRNDYSTLNALLKVTDDVRAAINKKHV